MGQHMGHVISLDERRNARLKATELPRARPRAAFFFDLASPFTYLAAERVDRLFPGLSWRPALTEALHSGDPLAAAGDREAVQRTAEDRAAALQMPLVWPDIFPSGARVAMRVASLAAAQGTSAASFVLAASRLAFCGGFDLNDPDVLLEAAAAANLRLRDCLAAATDEARDAALLDAGRRLAARGADRLPAMLVAHRVFCGEDRLAEAVAAARADAWELHRRRAGGR
jgi:2-hydroxychromene-2-carboxylate isomerase